MLLNTIENPIFCNNELESNNKEILEVNNSTFCPADTINSNMPSFQNATQSTTNVHPTSISTGSSAIDLNSNTSEVCQEEPTAHASTNYTTYLSVMPNVIDLSSEDEEMNHAILASIETHL